MIETNPVTQAEPKPSPLPSWVLLLVVSLVAGAYCVWLNGLLYQKRAPFHDSMSYYSRMHEVMTTTQTLGLKAGLESCLEQSTVFAPFIMAAGLSYVAEPTRAVGVWIQTGELFLFLFTLYYFLTTVERLRRPIAMGACLALLTLDCLFGVNGGLSDFRMDLSLMLMYGTTCLWFLISMKQPTWRHFVMMGCVAGLACLFRATAPVYLLLAIVPIWLLQMWRRPDRSPILIKTLVSIAICALVAGWFFIVNFDYLHYYYVVWNTDANAKLLFSQSLSHLWFVQDQLGWPFKIFAIVSIGVVSYHLGWKAWKPGIQQDRFVHVSLMFFGLVPVAFLVARGAGLNPFVSMPAAIGLFLFVSVWVARSVGQLESRQQVFLSCVLACCIIGALGRAYDKHVDPNVGEMAGHHQIVETILADAKLQRKESVRFEVQQMSEFNTHSLKSTILFDRASQAKDNGLLEEDGIRLQGSMLFSVAAVAEWAKVSGDSDSEKILNLTQSANAWLDYVVLVKDPGDSRFQKRYGSMIVNQKAVDLRHQLLYLGEWNPVGDPVQAKFGFELQVYRNEKTNRSRSLLRRDFASSYQHSQKVAKQTKPASAILR